MKFQRRPALCNAREGDGGQSNYRRPVRPFLSKNFLCAFLKIASPTSRSRRDFAPEGICNHRSILTSYVQHHEGGNEFIAEFNRQFKYQAGGKDTEMRNPYERAGLDERGVVILLLLFSCCPFC